MNAVVEKMALGPRIKELLKAKGWSQNELARRSGLLPSYVSQILSGKTQNTRGDYVIAIARAFDISTDELYGLKEYKKPDELSEYKSIAKEMTEVYKIMDAVKIPLRGSVPAGYPSTEEEYTAGYISVCKEDLPASTKGLYAVKVSGNSLTGDDIQDGDILIIEPTHDIIEGKIYILRLGNEVVARHVFTQDGNLRLTSSNSDYQVIKVEEAEIQGRVILSERRTKH